MDEIDLSANRRKLVATLIDAQDGLYKLILAHGGTGNQHVDNMLFAIASSCREAIGDVSDLA